MYLRHPSALLNALFAQRPYQGVEPAQASFLFVGLDANYEPDIERNPIFKDVQDYHENGVAFWRKTDVHHPFLLPRYSGDGRRYHRNFARIGFKPAHAELVSFIELLHVPTVGRNSLTPQDLDPGHLRYLNAVIMAGQAKHIFLSAGVARLMRASSAFPWLRLPRQESGPLRVFHRDEMRTVYLHLHFSNYGKFENQMIQEARAIQSLLPQVRSGHAI